ncbi:MAG: tetratricopeptide repeat protein [Bacteroidia bacterium]
MAGIRNFRAIEKKIVTYFAAAFLFLALQGQNPALLQDSSKVIGLNDRSKKVFLTGDYDSSLYYCTQAKILAESIGWKKGLAQSYNNIGLVYKNQGLYAESLKNHFAALKLREESGDKKGAASSTNNIGNVYQNQLNYPEALRYHLISLRLHSETGNKMGIAGSHNNLGSLYKDMRRFDEALIHHRAALAIRKSIGDNTGMGYSYTNIGNVFQSIKKYNEALKNYLLALSLLEENEKLARSTTYINIGAVYTRLKNYNKAEEYSLKALNITRDIGELEGMKDAYHNLSDIYDNTGRFDKALKFLKAFISARDSLTNEESTKKSLRLEMNYEFEKREAATQLEQEKREAVSLAESHKQKIIIFSVCGILGLVLAFAVFAYRSYLQKQKANEAILKQKMIIEEKQKEILDSILYAKRIQTALMPPELYFEKNLKRLKKTG